MKLHWISPYRTDKNIGKAINDAVKALITHGDDWICLTDHDVLFLLPETKEHIEKTLLRTDFDVLGCLTNRIGSTEQLFGGYFNDDSNILSHLGLAKQCWSSGGTLVKEAKGSIAAFMMCFRYSAWVKIGGFMENVLNFDSLFTMRARKMGLGIGVMQGIYVWHTYRLGSVNPRREIKHLLND